MCAIVQKEAQIFCESTASTTKDMIKAKYMHLKNTSLYKMLGTSEFEIVTTVSQRYNVLLSVNDPASWDMIYIYL